MAEARHTVRCAVGRFALEGCCTEALGRVAHRCIGAGRLECPQYTHKEVVQTMAIMDEAKRQIMA